MSAEATRRRALGLLALSLVLGRRWAFAFLAPGAALGTRDASAGRAHESRRRLKKDQPLEAGSSDGRAACGRAS
jgi:hypothetical protein